MIKILKLAGLTLTLACSTPVWAQGEGPVSEPMQAGTQRSRESLRNEAAEARRAPTSADGACAPIDPRSNRTRAEVRAEARATQRAGAMSGDACNQ